MDTFYMYYTGSGLGREGSATNDGDGTKGVGAVDDGQCLGFFKDILKYF
jgi:hypothetical protein